VDAARQRVVLDGKAELAVGEVSEVMGRPRRGPVEVRLQRNIGAAARPGIDGREVVEQRVVVHGRRRPVDGDVEVAGAEGGPRGGRKGGKDARREEPKSDRGPSFVGLFGHAKASGEHP